VLADIHLKSNRFGFEPEITAKVAKRRDHPWRIYEVPISYSGPHLRRRQEDRAARCDQRVLLHRALLDVSIEQAIHKDTKEHEAGIEPSPSPLLRASSCSFVDRNERTLHATHFRGAPRRCRARTGSARAICATSTTRPCTRSSSWTATRLCCRRRGRRLAHHRRRQDLGAPADRCACLPAFAPLPKPVHRLGRRPRGAAPRGRQHGRAAVHARRRSQVAASLRQRHTRPEQGRFTDNRTGFVVAMGPQYAPASSRPATAGRSWQPLPGPRCPAGWRRISRTPSSAPWPGPGAGWPWCATAASPWPTSIHWRPEPARPANRRERAVAVGRAVCAPER